MAVFIADEQDRPVDVDDLAAVARFVVAEQRVPQEMELSLLLVDEETIAALNAEHLDEDGPTDVLAFPMDDPGDVAGEVPAVLGDVVLCPAVAERQAEERGHPPQEELQMLAVHGVLHLIGMDHADPAEEREMFGLTERLLTAYRGADGEAPPR